MDAQGWRALIFILYSFWVPVVCYFSNVPVSNSLLQSWRWGEPVLSILSDYGPISDVQKIDCIRLCRKSRLPPPVALKPGCSF